MDKKYVVYSNDLDYYPSEEEVIESLIDAVFEDNDTASLVDNFGIRVSVTRDQYRNSLTNSEIRVEQNFLDMCRLEDAKQNLKDFKQKILIVQEGKPNEFHIYSHRWVPSHLCDVLDAFSNYKYDRTLYVDEHGELINREDGLEFIVRILPENEIYDPFWDTYPITRADIDKHTKKAGIEIGKIYGWDFDEKEGL